MTDKRTGVTFTPEVTEKVTEMGGKMGTHMAETTRRGLILLDWYLSLSDDEEVVIRNKRTESLERVHFNWGF